MQIDIKRTHSIQYLAQRQSSVTDTHCPFAEMVALGLLVLLQLLLHRLQSDHLLVQRSRTGYSIIDHTLIAHVLEAPSRARSWAAATLTSCILRWRSALLARTSAMTWHLAVIYNPCTVRHPRQVRWYSRLIVNVFETRLEPILPGAVLPPSSHIQERCSNSMCAACAVFVAATCMTSCACATL